MSDPVFEKFVVTVLRDAHLSRSKSDELRRELRAHFEDCIEYEMSCGLSRAEAVRRALDELGDPRALAHELERPFQLRRSIMRSLTAAACVTVIVTGASFLSSTLPAGKPGAGLMTALAQIGGDQKPNPGATGEGGWDRRIEHVDLKDVPLSDAFEYITDVLGSNVVVRWQQLEAMGINRDRSINLHLKNVTVRKLLELVLGEIGDRNVTFQEQDNVTLITSRDDQQGEMITRVYDVRDLVKMDSASSAGHAPEKKSATKLSPDDIQTRIQSDELVQLYETKVGRAQSALEKLKSEQTAEMVAGTDPPVVKKADGNGEIRFPSKYESKMSELRGEMDHYKKKLHDRRDELEAQFGAQSSPTREPGTYSADVRLIIDADPIVRYYMAEASATQAELAKRKIDGTDANALQELQKRILSYNDKEMERRSELERKALEDGTRVRVAEPNILTSPAQKLVEVIQGAVEPDCWNVNGGRGFADIFSGALVVRQSPEMHRQVMRFLDELRTVVKTPAGAATPQ